MWPLLQSLLLSFIVIQWLFVAAATLLKLLHPHNSFDIFGCFIILDTKKPSSSKKAGTFDSECNVDVHVIVMWKHRMDTYQRYYSIAQTKHGDYDRLKPYWASTAIALAPLVKTDIWEQANEYNDLQWLDYITVNDIKIPCSLEWVVLCTGPISRKIATLVHRRADFLIIICVTTRITTR